MKPIRSSLLFSALLAALGGCGPGTGGTGVGPSAAWLEYFGATTASVCTAPFSGSLSCAPSSVTSIGTATVHYADVASGGNVSVVIEANTITLQALCQRLTFTGDWGVAPGSDTRFFGSYLVEPQTQRIPSTLTLQTVTHNGASAISIVLREASGLVVLGPLTLQPVPATPTATAGCQP